MNSKLTVVGAISAAVGAVVSWAVTADYYEQKRKEAEEMAADYERLLRASEDEVYELQKRVTTVFNQTNVHTDLPPEQIYRQTAELLRAAKGGIPDLSEKLKKLEKTSAEKVAEMAAEHAEEDVQGEVDPNDPNVVDFAVYHENPETGVVEVVAEEEAFPPEETLEETTSNLQAIIEQYTSNPEDHDEFIAAVVDPPARTDAAPYVITKEDYSWGEEGIEYENKTLAYYPSQRLLLDEDEEPIDDVPQTVGWRNLQRFGDESGDPDTVFIRNRKLRMDFEVVRELEAKPPLHVAYGMDRETFKMNKAAGLIRLRPEDT